MTLMLLPDRGYGHQACHRSPRWEQEASATEAPSSRPGPSWFSWFIVLMALMMAGCAHANDATTISGPGFWTGLLHGIISPLALVLSFFTEIGVYAVHNLGTWYDIGFLAGLFALVGAASASSQGVGGVLFLLAAAAAIVLRLLIDAIPFLFALVLLLFDWARQSRQ